MTTKASDSSRSAEHDKKKSSTTPTLSGDAFDKLADTGGDISAYMDEDKSIRSGRGLQRVNVDIPIALLRTIDEEARRIGVTRQAFIKMHLADVVSPTPASIAKVVELMEALRKSLDTKRPSRRSRKKVSAA